MEENGRKKEKGRNEREKRFVKKFETNEKEKAEKME